MPQENAESTYSIYYILIIVHIIYRYIKISENRTSMDTTTDKYLS